MPKLTPKEAFEFIRQLNPSAVMIKPVCGEGRSVVFFDDKCGGEHWSCPNIDWGDATSYKPERWRPATIDDVKAALDEPFECRVSGDGGLVLAGGYVKADGLLVFECRKDGCTTREPSGDVEVLDA